MVSPSENDAWDPGNRAPGSAFGHHPLLSFLLPSTHVGVGAAYSRRMPTRRRGPRAGFRPPSRPPARLAAHRGAPRVSATPSVGSWTDGASMGFILQGPARRAGSSSRRPAPHDVPRRGRPPPEEVWAHGFASRGLHTRSGCVAPATCVSVQRALLGFPGPSELAPTRTGARFARGRLPSHPFAARRLPTARISGCWVTGEWVDPSRDRRLSWALSPSDVWHPVRNCLVRASAWSPRHDILRMACFAPAPTPHAASHARAGRTPSTWFGATVPT